MNLSLEQAKLPGILYKLLQAVSFKIDTAHSLKGSVFLERFTHGRQKRIIAVDSLLKGFEK